MNLRECSVRLWRCDLAGGEDAARTGRGGPPACRGPWAAAAALNAQHVQSGCKASMSAFEMEADCKGTVVKQEPDVNHSQLWSETGSQPDLCFPQEHVSVIKMEDDADKITIKQELDIGPTMLQSWAPVVVCSAVVARRARDSLDPRLGTDSGGAATATPFGTSLSYAALRTDLEGGRYEEDWRVSLNTDLEPALRGEDDAGQRALGQQSLDRADDGGTLELADKQHERDCLEYTTTRNTNPIIRNKKRYRCDLCKYSTLQLKNLKVHRRAHTGKKAYKCEQCEYSTSVLISLKHHMNTHMGERPYKCELCEYATSWLGNLKEHIRTHTGERLFKCEQCEYSTPRISHLKEHMHIHTGERPFKCEQCEYRATRTSHLKVHMRTHTGERPYKCELCQYTSSRLGNLKVHLRTHTGERPYKCEKCEYSSSQLGNLKEHIRTHTGERLHK